MAASPILVIGSSNVDFVMRVESLPERGETVTDGIFIQTYGGKGANQAVAAARAGGKVTFVTAVGDDHYGAIMSENFRQDGICTDYMIRDPMNPSGSALVMTDAHGENYLSVAPGANYSLAPTHVDALAPLFTKESLLVLQMEIPTQTILRVLDLARSAGVRTMLNYAPIRDLSVPVTDLMDVLVVNENEAASLTGLTVDGLEQGQQAAEALHGRGPGIVVVTLGKDGACLVSDSGSEHEPAFPVSAVDTTAAGDTFCGALAVAMQEGREMREAVRFACAASALSVQRLGAQPSIPYRIEIDRFLAAKQ